MPSPAAVIGTLTLSAPQTKTDTSTNSVDPNESACNSLFAILFWFYTKTPILGHGHVHIQRWNSPLRDMKLSVKIFILTVMNVFIIKSLN